MWTFSTKSFINNIFLSIIMYSILYIIYNNFYNKKCNTKTIKKNTNNKKIKKGGNKKNKCLVSQEIVDKDYEKYYEDLFNDVKMNEKGPYESINENNLNSNLLLK